MLNIVNRVVETDVRMVDVLRIADVQMADLIAHREIDRQDHRAISHRIRMQHLLRQCQVRI